MIEDLEIYREKAKSKVELEMIVKFYNDIVSENRTKRHQIDILRKERTLYDSIFKDLEVKVKKEEEKLLKILELTRGNELSLKENSEYLNSMHGVLEKNKSGSLRELMTEQKELYGKLSKNKNTLKMSGSNMQISIINSTTDIANSGKRKSIMRKFISNSRSKKTPKNNGMLETIKQYQRQEKEKKIAELDHLLLDVKIKSEECNFENLIKTFKNVANHNEELYKEYLDLENEV
jgi:hypothetical protein